MGKTDLTSKKMQIDDYCRMMDANAHLYPEWSQLDQAGKELCAARMIAFGSAEGVYDGDRLVGCQGILQLGVGEAWMVMEPAARENAGALLRHSIKEFKRLRDLDGYFRIYAENTISEPFLKHLGFSKSPDTHIWVRKDSSAPRI
jgi:hypothetical protein